MISASIKCEIGNRITTSVSVEAIPKNGIWLKVKEEAKRQPEEYMTYFEDWLFASDKEIGP